MFDFTKLKKIQSARPHMYGLGYPSQPSPRVTLSELTFHLFLYKVQPTVYMRLWTRLGKAKQLEGEGEGEGGGMRAHAKARMFTAILSLSSAILSNM